MNLDLTESDIQGLVVNLRPRISSEKKGFLLFQLSFQGAALRGEQTKFFLTRPERRWYKDCFVDLRDGLGKVTNLPEGIYDVVFSKFGFEPVILRGVTIPNPELLEIELKPAPYVRGRVLVKGKEKPTFMEIFDKEGHVLHVVTLAKSGQFTIPGLVPGEYEIVARKGNSSKCWKAPQGLSVRGADYVEIPLEEEKSEGEENP